MYLVSEKYVSINFLNPSYFSHISAEYSGVDARMASCLQTYTFLNASSTRPVGGRIPGEERWKNTRKIFLKETKLCVFSTILWR